MNDDTPRIQFARARDGVRIAFTVTGEGAPMVYTPAWVSHQELEWRGPVGAFHRRLAQGRQLILFDGRGTGLSDRQVDDVSLAARLLDLEAVVDHLGLERFILSGVSQWTPVALTYAAEHPERVEKLVLYAPFCEGFVTGEEEDKAPLGRALIDLIRAEWGVGARTTMGFVHPDADREEQEEGLAYLRQSSAGAVAARILEEGMFETRICDLVPRIQAPSLVLHRRNDNAVPLECGRRVASLLPDTRFVPLEGDHHLTYYGDSESVIRAINEFLGVSTPAATPTPAASSTWAISEILQEGTVTILFTDMESSTALTQRLGDEKAQELVRSHNSIVREALGAHGGSEVKHTGDGIMATFSSAARALECAVAIQRSLEKHNESSADAPVHVRIGLNAGEPVREDGDIFGTAVQTAARIRDRAEPGQILISDVVRQLVAGKGFLFADLGDCALQGFEDPVRLYEVRWRE